MKDSSEKIRLTFVFLQFDRAKYPAALERLIALAVSLDAADYRIVVVDNARPGPWRHEVSDRITHLGGDNSAWEFSAFDRGVAAFEAEGAVPDLYAFVTDAFLAYGDDYLDLVTNATLGYALGLGACIGWVDNFDGGRECTIDGRTYDAWMRTSLLFMPAAIRTALGALSTPLDREAIFGTEAQTPFRESAPVSANLRSLLLSWLTTRPTDSGLQEAWHSQMELTEATFDAFRDKVCAILREHLLSARLRELGTPCFDFRLLDQLRSNGVAPEAISATQRRDWQWLGFRGAQVDKQPRFGIDAPAFPVTIVHGEPTTVPFAGWVVSEPQVRDVFFRFSDAAPIRAVCDTVRPDVIAGYPEFRDELCGFRFEARLDHLPAGRHEVALSAPEIEWSSALGRLEVLPRCTFSLTRCWVPEVAAAGQQVPVVVEGTVLASAPLESTRVSWNGEPVDAAPTIIEERRQANGLRRYLLSLVAEVAVPEFPVQNQLELELISPGARDVWSHFAMIEPREGLAHVLLQRDVGGSSPTTGQAEVHLKGALWLGDRGGELRLLREGEVIVTERLQPATRRSPVQQFDVQRLASIPGGVWNFELAFAPTGEPASCLAEWQDRVLLHTPTIQMDHFVVTRPWGRTHYIIETWGWVKHHELVEALQLKVDGELVDNLAFTQLRPDVARHEGRVVALRQGFLAYLDVEAEPGERLVEIEAISGGRAGVGWRQMVKFEEPSAEPILESEELAAFSRAALPRFWSSIRIRGHVNSELKKDVFTGSLFVDDHLVDRQWVAPYEPFMLSGIPVRSGTRQVRVVFDSRGRALYDSGPRAVAFQKVEVPRDLVRTVEAFLETLRLRPLLGLPATLSAEDVARFLLEGKRRFLPQYLEMARDIGAALATGEAEPPELIRGGRRSPERPLKVLFATWEAPGLRHGGGVWMTSLLRELGKRHEITVLHSNGPGEESWVEDYRDSVADVVSVLRSPDVEQFARDPRPRMNYCADLHSALQTELFSGAYDIVDYHYMKMYEHRSKSELPEVLTVHEEPVSARLSSLSQESLSDTEKLKGVEALLDQFYLGEVALPRAYRHLIGVTGEDAAFLARFQRSAQIHVNLIGADWERLAPQEAERELADPPTLVFLGNYRHPPNEAAATFFAKEVMPEVRQRFPRVEFQILGAHPTPQVKELAQEDNVSVLGFVEDFRPYLWQAAAFVSPLFIGAGMRVKILEAVATGVPVVGTALSFQGFGAEAGRHYLQAETASDFVKAACYCLDHPREAAEIGDRARQLVVDDHSAAASAREREQIWAEVIADAAERRKT